MRKARLFAYHHRRFLLSRRFAGILIGVFSGLTMGILVSVMTETNALIAGALFGFAMCELYLGICEDIKQEAKRRSTYDIKRTTRKIA